MEEKAQHMKQYKKNYELKNAARDRLEGKYKGAISIMFLSFVISWFARLVVNSVANSTMRSVYAMSGSVSAARAVTIVFDVVLLAANILLGVMNAGIALYFLNIACGQQPFTRDLFYGFKNDSKKALVVSAAVTLCNTVCLGPGQYLSQNLLNTRDAKWMLPALLATAVGLCVYVPISLGLAMSFFLMLDFPEKSGKETPEAVLAPHEGEPEAPVPAGAELPAFDASVPPKLRHRFPVAGAFHADDLHLFLSRFDESRVKSRMLCCGGKASDFLYSPIP